MKTIIAHMIDCATPLTAADCEALKEQGITIVGRYLGAKTRGWAKGLIPEEVKNIADAGLEIVSIWEGDPTYPGYFTREQALKDASDALEEAHWLGQSKLSAVYFTVDYDAAPADLPGIEIYIRTIASVFPGYLVGLYGGIRVVEAVNGPHCYWQTCAWSNDQISPRADIYQHPSDTIGTLAVDKDDVYAQPGSWTSHPPDVPVAELPKDVPPDLWCADGVQYALSHRLMGLFPGDEFRPDEPMTRGQAAVALQNLAKELIR